MTNTNDYYNDELNAWIIDDIQISDLKNDINKLIQCTSENDIVMFKMTTSDMLIELKETIVITHPITLTSYTEDVGFGDDGVFVETPDKTFMTCPRKQDASTSAILDIK